MPDGNLRVMVSLHDVTPAHQERIDRALQLLDTLGFGPVALLVVPNFHGQWPIQDFPDFCHKLRQWQDLGHELVLHGFYHQELAQDVPEAGNWQERFQRNHMTGGEGEFLALSPQACAQRLDDGLAVWNRLGLTPPSGFIPPAWLHNEHLDPALWERGFTWTENHQGFRFANRQKLSSPVISWASRDRLRRQGSRVVCPLLERLWRSRSPLRIALHPHDFDWPQLQTSIEGVLKRVRQQRREISSHELIGILN